ncbi:MAG: prenyltransferase/squalene oxidase repeat-containing protein [Candidatus Bathyarchaeia archaeon]
MSVSDELKVDPLNYVAGLKSPIGVYLRREIFTKETKADRALKRELYEKTVANQSTDGSWNQLFVRTANDLWNLALLGYDEKDTAVKKGLDWILSIQTHEYRGYPGFFYSKNREDRRAMRSTLYGEFVPGCSLFYQTTYAIHLFHIFDLDEDNHVQTAVRSYLRLWGDNEWLCGSWCGSNVLRVLIEHPLSRDSKQVENGLKYLTKCQSKSGAWKGLPFYHIFHALSRANNVSAKEQLSKAFQSLVKRQNQDGSWGRKERETATFLVLDALKNAFQKLP